MQNFSTRGCCVGHLRLEYTIIGWQRHLDAILKILKKNNEEKLPNKEEKRIRINNCENIYISCFFTYSHLCYEFCKSDILKHTKNKLHNCSKIYFVDIFLNNWNTSYRKSVFFATKFCTTLEFLTFNRIVDQFSFSISAKNSTFSSLDLVFSFFFAIFECWRLSRNWVCVCPPTFISIVPQ